MGSRAAHKNKKHSLNAFILKMHPSKRICIFVTFLHLCCLFWYLHFYLLKMNACSMGSMAAHRNKKHSLNAFILKMHPSNSICSFVTFLHFCCLFQPFLGFAFLSNENACMQHGSHGSSQKSETFTKCIYSENTHLQQYLHFYLFFAFLQNENVCILSIDIENIANTLLGPK